MKNILTRSHISYSILLLALTTGQSLIAGSIAVLPGISGLQDSNYPSNVTLGWGFSLVSPVTVTDLGYYDGNDGLTDPHPVGIWDDTGSLVAQGTVPAGTAGDLGSGFQFVPIAPVVLDAGQYTIGGYANGTSPDVFLFEIQSLTTIPELTFGLANLYTEGDTLTLPTTTAEAFSLNGYFGPNFEVGTAVVVPAPDPGTGTMVLLGLIAAGSCFRGRRTSV